MHTYTHTHVCVCVQIWQSGTRTGYHEDGDIVLIYHTNKDRNFNFLLCLFTIYVVQPGNTKINDVMIMFSVASQFHSLHQRRILQRSPPQKP